MIARPEAHMVREAQRWHLRLKDSSATEADRRQFFNWLEQDPAHARAYERAEQLWDTLRSPAAALGAGGWHRAERRRPFRFQTVLAAAASVAIVALGIGWQSPGLVDRTFADISAAPGHPANISLADGSQVYLDGDSAVDVDLADEARNVKLIRGRTWFDVSHDTSRPFFVRAGDVTVRVVGTAFAVERRADAVIVTVERGKVAVTDADTGKAALLSPGQQLVLNGPETQGPNDVSAETSLAWRRGLIVFDRASLETVAGELNRMGAGHIFIADDSLRTLTLSGVFQSDDISSVLDALETGLNLRITRVPGVLTILQSSS